METRDADTANSPTQHQATSHLKADKTTGTMMLQLLENGATIKELAESAAPIPSTRKSGKRSRCFQLFSLLSLADVTGAWVSPTTTGGRIAYCGTAPIMSTTSTMTQLAALSVGGRTNSMKIESKKPTSRNWWEPMPSLQSKNSSSRNRRKRSAAAGTATRTCKPETNKASFLLPTVWKTQASPQLRHADAARKSTPKATSRPTPRQQHFKTTTRNADFATHLQRQWEHHLRELMDLLMAAPAQPPSRTTVRITGLTIVVLLTHLAVDQWWSDDTTAVVHWAATNAYLVAVLARPLRWGQSMNDE